MPGVLSFQLSFDFIHLLLYMCSIPFFVLYIGDLETVYFLINIFNMLNSKGGKIIM